MTKKNIFQLTERAMSPESTPASIYSKYNSGTPKRMSRNLLFTIALRTSDILGDTKPKYLQKTKFLWLNSNISPQKKSTF